MFEAVFAAPVGLHLDPFSSTSDSRLLPSVNKTKYLAYRVARGTARTVTVDAWSCRRYIHLGGYGCYGTREPSLRIEGGTNLADITGSRMTRAPLYNYYHTDMCLGKSWDGPEVVVQGPGMARALDTFLVIATKTPPYNRRM
jgi:hypothetical protein